MCVGMAGPGHGFFFFSVWAGGTLPRLRSRPPNSPGNLFLNSCRDTLFSAEDPPLVFQSSTPGLLSSLFFQSPLFIFDRCLPFCDAQKMTVRDFVSSHFFLCLRHRGPRYPFRVSLPIFGGDEVSERHANGGAPNSLALRSPVSKSYT